MLKTVTHLTRALVNYAKARKLLNGWIAASIFADCKALKLNTIES
jgi:hypothetical protein